MLGFAALGCMGVGARQELPWRSHVAGGGWWCGCPAAALSMLLRSGAGMALGEGRQPWQGALAAPAQSSTLQTREKGRCLPGMQGPQERGDTKLCRACSWSSPLSGHLRESRKGTSQCSGQAGVTGSLHPLPASVRGKPAAVLSMQARHAGLDSPLPCSVLS